MLDKLELAKKRRKDVQGKLVPDFARRKKKTLIINLVNGGPIIFVMVTHK
jgi:hypothetical protein